MLALGVVADAERSAAAATVGAARAAEVASSLRAVAERVRGTCAVEWHSPAGVRYREQAEELTAALHLAADEVQAAGEALRAFGATTGERGEHLAGLTRQARHAVESRAERAEELVRQLERGLPGPLLLP